MRLKPLGSMLTMLAGLALVLPPVLAVPQGGHPEGSHHPPTQGKMVRGHWTPYESPDPDLYPEESRVHIIVPGDTLWDLSQTYLGDPWLWPQLWDQNRYILDSHWIYPGDPLLIPPTPIVVADVPPTEDPTVPPAEVEVRPLLDTAATVPERAPPVVVGPELRPVASESDLYCSSYLDEPVGEETLVIAQREEQAKSLLSEWDVVFLSQGLAQGVQPGNEYLVYRPGRLVEHPDSGEVLGQVIQQVGRLKVIASQDQTATAYITRACTEILMGDRLVPFEEVPVPLTVYPGWERYGVDITDADKGAIVYSADDRGELGRGHLVELDLGTADGLEPGDYVLIYREFQSVPDFTSVFGMKDAGEMDHRFPPNILGQAVVIRAKEHTSTAKIVRSAIEVAIGDKVAKK